MPFWLFSIGGGAAITYFLIEEGYVWHAFWGLIIFIIALWVFPSLSLYVFMIEVGLILLMLVLAYWEFIAGMILAVILTFLIIFGLAHAINSAKADDYMDQPCHAVEECE